MVVCGNADGKLLFVSGQSHGIFKEHSLGIDAGGVTVISHSPTGETLVCGTSTGRLYVLDSRSMVCLGEEQPFLQNFAIEQCSFYTKQLFAVSASLVHILKTLKFR